MPQRTCGLCTAEQFEVGYGARRKVEGVWDEVGDKCAAPHTEREVQKAIDFVEGLKREHSDIDWSQFLDKAYRSQRRYRAWKARFGSEPDRVKGFLRLCEDDSRWISRTAKRNLIDEYLRRAKATMDKIGEVEIQIDTEDSNVVRRLQKRQGSLNRVHERIMRGIKLIEENLEMLDTRGLLKGPASWNVLNVTVSQAVQAYLRSQDYQQGKDMSDEHKIAQATRLATQGLSVEEVEAAGEDSIGTGTPVAKNEVDEALAQEPETEVETAIKTEEQPEVKTALPSRMIKGTKTKQSKEKAMAFFEEQGGFPKLGIWRANNTSGGPKSISLSGCNANPAAAERAMREVIEES